MPRGVAQSLNNLGTALRCQGEYAAAFDLHNESLEIFRELGDKWSDALALANMGLAALDMAEYERGGALLRESLGIFREAGVRQGVATCLEGLAGVAGRLADGERAARLFGAAEALREAISVPLPPYDRADYKRNLAAARDALNGPVFQRSWSRGRFDRKIGAGHPGWGLNRRPT